MSIKDKEIEVWSKMKWKTIWQIHKRLDWDSFILNHFQTPIADLMNFIEIVSCIVSI